MSGSTDDGFVRIPSDGEKNNVRCGDHDSENGKDLAEEIVIQDGVAIDPSPESRSIGKICLISRPLRDALV